MHVRHTDKAYTPPRTRTWGHSASTLLLVALAPQALFILAEEIHRTGAPVGLGAQAHGLAASLPACLFSTLAIRDAKDSHPGPSWAVLLGTLLRAASFPTLISLRGVGPAVQC